MGWGFIIIACIPIIGSMIEDRGWPNAAVAVGGAIVILFGVLGYPAIRRMGRN